MGLPVKAPCMIELGAVPECFPIAAFLAAEVDSSRWRAVVYSHLWSLGRTRALVENPNYSDTAENEDRKTILLSAYRGYPDALLFRGFPGDAQWFRVKLEPLDFDSMRYANVPMTQQLSGRTLLVKDGATNLSRFSRLPEGAEHIPEVLAELREGRSFPPLLAVEGPGVPLTLLEGHSRATAYVIESKTVHVEAYVARSQFMANWAFRGD